MKNSRVPTPISVRPSTIDSSTKPAGVKRLISSSDSYEEIENEVYSLYPDAPQPMEKDWISNFLAIEMSERGDAKSPSYREKLLEIYLQKFETRLSKSEIKVLKGNSFLGSGS